MHVNVFKYFHTSKCLIFQILLSWFRTIITFHLTCVIITVDKVQRHFTFFLESTVSMLSKPSSLYHTNVHKTQFSLLIFRFFFSFRAIFLYYLFCVSPCNIVSLLNYLLYFLSYTLDMSRNNAEYISLLICSLPNQIPDYSSVLNTF